MKRELVKTITAKGNRELVCYINRVDDSYYEVVYNRKSEYLTNNLNTAILVAKIIIVYHQNLNKCNELLYKTNIPKEKRWDNVLELLRKEYVKSPIDSKISLKIYETLDSNYQGLSDVKTKNDMDKLSIVATITAKDKLMEAISETTSSIEPNTAYKNYNRYIKLRNPYIEKNPYLGLRMLGFIKIKEDDENEKRIDTTKNTRQIA